MATAPIYDLEKNKVGSVELPDPIFAVEVKPHLIHDMVRAQIARRYEYKTANSLTRTEVHGTRKKMYKQKGTGQARHGDAKAPIFVGGGKAFGPRPHRARHKINKKVAAAALRSALTLNSKEDRLFVLSKLELEKPSTKAVTACQKIFEISPVLFVNTDEAAAEKSFNTSVRNIKSVKFLKPEGVNVFDVLKYRNIVISEKAMKQLIARLEKSVPERSANV